MITLMVFIQPPARGSFFSQLGNRARKKNGSEKAAENAKSPSNGQSRSPLSTLKELDAFNEHHIERCGRPIQKIAFYAEAVADALVLPDCASKEAAYSVMEALRQGAAEVLDMEISDLQVQVFGKPGSETYDALLYDPMPGGSGLLEQMIGHWPAVIQRALSLVEDCPSACETSCVDCLQHFRNSFYHADLNRHTAQEYLREWGPTVRFSHLIPAALPQYGCGQCFAP
jgi:hypothetical protein